MANATIKVLVRLTAKGRLVLWLGNHVKPRWLRDLAMSAAVRIPKAWFRDGGDARFNGMVRADLPRK